MFKMQERSKSQEPKSKHQHQGLSNYCPSWVASRLVSSFVESKASARASANFASLFRFKEILIFANPFHAFAAPGYKSLFKLNTKRDFSFCPWSSNTEPMLFNSKLFRK